MPKPSSPARPETRKPVRVNLAPPTVLPLRTPADAQQQVQMGPGTIYHEKRPESRVAVLVCHGMGQQVAYETLDCVAQKLATTAGTEEVTMRHVRIGDRRLPRAEVKLDDSAGNPREVHVYESYWAPLMEGRVTALDVTRFLLSSGFSGIRHALSGSFDRWMFGGNKSLPIHPQTPFVLVAAFAVLVSALVLYATLALVAVGQAGEFLFLPSGSTWNGAPLVEGLSLELFRSPLALSLVATPLMLWFRQRPTPSTAPVGVWTRVARWTMSALVIVASWQVLVWAKAVHPSPLETLRILLTWVAGNAGLVAGVLTAGAAVAGLAVVLARRGWLGVPVAVLLLGVGVWTVWSAWMIAGWLTQWVSRSGPAKPDRQLAEWEAALAALADQPFYPIFLFCAVVLCVGLRWFYVQYFGDVAAYLSSHTVNKFHEVRAQIRALGRETARAVYGAGRADRPSQPEYDRVLVVGHSLGSVVAYDTLNSILNEDATGAGLNVQDRTQALVTFGSPLDRTAFIFRTFVKNAEGREALAAGAQPLIHPIEGGGRTTPWFNLYSPYDPISSFLRYYDPPEGGAAPHGHVRVKNIRDRAANIPLVAHTRYWENPLLAEILHHEATQAVAYPPVPEEAVLASTTAAEGSPAVAAAGDTGTDLVQ